MNQLQIVQCNPLIIYKGSPYLQQQEMKKEFLTWLQSPGKYYSLKNIVTSDKTQLGLL